MDTKQHRATARSASAIEALLASSPDVRDDMTLYLSTWSPPTSPCKIIYTSSDLSAWIKTIRPVQVSFKALEDYLEWGKSTLQPWRLPSTELQVDTSGFSQAQIDGAVLYAMQNVNSDRYVSDSSGKVLSDVAHMFQLSILVLKKMKILPIQADADIPHSGFDIIQAGRKVMDPVFATLHAAHSIRKGVDTVALTADQFIPVLTATRAIELHAEDCKMTAVQWAMRHPDSPLVRSVAGRVPPQSAKKGK